METGNGCAAAGGVGDIGGAAVGGGGGGTKGGEGADGGSSLPCRWRRRSAAINMAMAIAAIAKPTMPAVELRIFKGRNGIQ